jgi:hypothetical protein
MAPVTNDSTVGYWGPATSTLDWCEKNYEVFNKYRLTFVCLSVGTLQQSPSVCL